MTYNEDTLNTTTARAAITAYSLGNTPIEPSIEQFAHAVVVIPRAKIAAARMIVKQYRQGQRRNEPSAHTLVLASQPL